MVKGPLKSAEKREFLRFYKRLKKPVCRVLGVAAHMKGGENLGTRSPQTIGNLGRDVSLYNASSFVSVFGVALLPDVLTYSSIFTYKA